MLHEAVITGRTEIVEMLLKGGARINAKDMVRVHLNTIHRVHNLQRYRCSLLIQKQLVLKMLQFCHV